MIEASINLDQLLKIAAPMRETARAQSWVDAVPTRARIGVARDAAFQFYYPENLQRLRAAGAEIVFWSPQVADTLPDVDGLYLGGGYPELHARELSENEGVRKAVRAFAEAGRPIYAECGGLMYLAETLEDPEGVAHPMVGVLPATVRMRPSKLSLGYTEVFFTSDTPLGPAGTVARGHEFHYSTLDLVPDSVARAWRVEKRRGGARAEGYVIGRTLMSYVHLHFASCPEIPRRFVDACTETQ
jgi:cobyrinic acid a,c-diamide synthase